MLIVICRRGTGVLSGPTTIINTRTGRRLAEPGWAVEAEGEEDNWKVGNKPELDKSIQFRFFVSYIHGQIFIYAGTNC